MSPQALLDALKRYLNLVVKPEEEWNLVIAQNPPVSEAIFPFSVLGLVASMLLFIPGVALRIGEKSIILETLGHVFMDGASVAAFAAVAWLVCSRVDAVRPAMGPVVALYSATGMWLATLLHFVPLPVLGWLWLLMGAVYTGYLFARGLDVVVGVPGHRRLIAIAVPMAAMVVVNGALRLLCDLLLVP